MCREKNTSLTVFNNKMYSFVYKNNVNTRMSLGLYGIPLVLIVFGLQVYTAVLLGKSWIIASALDPQISRKNRYCREFSLTVRL